MTSPEEIYQKAYRRYHKILSQHLLGNSPDLELKVNKSYKELTLAKFREKIADLKGGAKEKLGFGYTLQFKKVSIKELGEQHVPQRIFFEHLDDYIKYIGKEEEFSSMIEDVQCIRNSFPVLNNWTATNPGKVILHDKLWPDILSVLHFLIKDFLSGKFFAREIPLKISTKFIEQNAAIIEELLYEIAPDRIDKFGANFYQRIGFKKDLKMVRMRMLDKIDFVHESVSDLMVTTEGLSNLKIQSQNVFIVENLTVFLTFPTVHDSIVIWGKGFEISCLKDIRWLDCKKIYYWGDLDTDGLFILSQLRRAFPHTTSLFMTLNDIHKYKEWEITYSDNKNRDISSLYKDEVDAYEYLQSHSSRIEQERIPNDHIIERLKAIGFKNGEGSAKTQ